MREVTWHDPTRTRAAPAYILAPMGSVWIVKNDDDEVLGMFGAEDEAAAYAEEVGPTLPDGAQYTYFDIPWRKETGTTLLMP